LLFENEKVSQVIFRKVEESPSVCDSTTSSLISGKRKEGGRGRVLYLCGGKESLLFSCKLVCSGEEIYNSIVAGARVEIRL